MVSCLVLFLLLFYYYCYYYSRVQHKHFIHHHPIQPLFNPFGRGLGRAFLWKSCMEHLSILSISSYSYVAGPSALYLLRNPRPAAVFP